MKMKIFLVIFACILLLKYECKGIQRIRISDVFLIKVFCYYNCKPAYTNTVTMLKAVCNTKYCPEHVHFSWSIAPHPPYFDFARDTFTAQNGRSLHINKGAFKGGSKISFMAMAKGQSKAITIEFEDKLEELITIHCVRNCPVSDPTRDAIYTAECKGCGDESFKWHISSKPSPDFDFNANSNKSDDGRTVTILAYAFKMNEKATLHVTGYTPQHKELRAAHILKFEAVGPHLSIECSSNCKDEAFVDKETKLQAICTAQCQNENYNWTIFPATDKFTIADENNKNFTILPYAYLGGVNVKVTMHQNKSDDIEYSFLTKGNCSLTPLKGYSGVTNFFVNCSYADDIKISVFQHIPFSESYEDGVLLYEGKNVSGNPLLLSEGIATNITIIIKEFTNHTFKVQVDVLRMPSASGNEKIENTIKKKILQQGGNESLSALLNNGEFSTAIQMASLLLSSLNDLIDESFKSHYRRHILERFINIVDTVDPEQLLTLLVKCVEGEAIAGDPVAEHLAAECLNAAVWNINNHCCNYTDQELEHIGHDVLLVVEHLSHTPDIAVVESLKGQEGNDYGVDYPTYTDLDINRAKSLYNIQVLTHFMMDSLQGLGSIVNAKGSPMNFKFHGMASSSQKLSLKPEIVKLTNIGSYLNISSELATELTSKDYMTAQMATLKPNPFWWHPISDEIHSELLMVNFFYDEFKLTTLNNYLDIFLETYDDDIMPIKGVLDEDKVIFVHKFDGQAGTKVDILFKYFNNDYLVLISTTYPTMYEIKEYGFKVMSTRKNVKSIIMDDDFLFIGIARIMNVEPFYEIQIKMSKCVSWSDEERQWTSKHCRLGTFSNGIYTHCQCNHLSVFGISIIVPPNRIMIEHDMELSEMIRRSSLVLIFLTVILIMWVIVMIWAHYRDNAMNKAAKTMNVPIDNMPGDEHLYILSVETGIWFRSGTTARVAVQLTGENGKSRVHLIHGHGLLQRGTEDWYAIYSPEDLGNVKTIHIFHDSYGDHPSWYCERLTVHHPASRRMFVFAVQQWFSLLWGDGRVERYISVTHKSKQRSGTVLFPRHAKTQIREEHLWLSIFTRPPGCSFTSKERVTVGFTMILVSMLSSAMFYGLNDTNSLEPTSTLQLTVREIVILFESLLITLPAGFLLLLFFKRSRPFALKPVR